MVNRSIHSPLRCILSEHCPMIFRNITKNTATITSAFLVVCSTASILCFMIMTVRDSVSGSILVVLAIISTLNQRRLKGLEKNERVEDACTNAKFCACVAFFIYSFICRHPFSMAEVILLFFIAANNVSFILRSNGRKEP